MNLVVLPETQVLTGSSASSFCVEAAREWTAGWAMQPTEAAATGADPVEDQAALARGAVAPLAISERTLFFSDVVGSTQLVEAIGDQPWTELVTWLDVALRQCVAETSWRGSG